MEKINLGLELKKLVRELSALLPRLSELPGPAGPDREELHRLLKILDEAAERDNTTVSLLFQFEEKLSDPAARAPLMEGLKKLLDQQQENHHTALEILRRWG